MRYNVRVPTISETFHMKTAPQVGTAYARLFPSGHQHQREFRLFLLSLQRLFIVARQRVYPCNGSTFTAPAPLHGYPTPHQRASSTRDVKKPLTLFSGAKTYNSPRNFSTNLPSTLQGKPASVLNQLDLLSSRFMVAVKKISVNFDQFLPAHQSLKNV